MRYPYTYGGGSAQTTISNASGENDSNDGPNLPVIGAVLAGAYVVYKTVM